MRNIKTYSRKYYTFKINPFYYNPITLYRSCCLPHEAFFPFDFEKFTYEFERRHGLLQVSEDSEKYSYS